jgi:3-hydroxyacyl-CoA dehydrogenase/enoyl-CoA hydratase/3-hydroxybutyryl-CoA epimerase/3-hydroxyacyl-CoA dehydrogenase/enoyl-CoA hydratase/3-hydroxybutyryl-CoA epimerase/enoyl-CoA isomerase
MLLRRQRRPLFHQGCPIMTQSAATSPDNAALRLEIHNNLAVVTFDMPGSRANTLGVAILAELERVVDQLEHRQDLAGFILRSGKPGMFIAGADLRELGAAEHDPNQTRQLVQRGLGVIERIENLPYPTVVLVDGACMGGGTELALGFDYRLAGTHPKMEIGLPEVKIGLIPGWGGTQRMTRLIGPPLAAELICAGEAVKAERAYQLGLVNDVVPSERMMDEAKRLLDWTQETGDWQQARRRKQQPVGLSEDQLSFTYAVARATVLSKTKGQLPAPVAALEAIIKGCNLTLQDGLKVETEQFVPLVGSPISKNLIAIFFMTQALQKDTGIADKSIQPREVHRVGVIGAGIMGSGIAGAHIRRGVPTLMLDKVPGALDKGLKAIAKSMQGRIEIGRMKQEEMLAAFSKLNTSDNMALLSDREVVIEAIIEDEPTKVALFKELHSILKPDAILASNTSTISITRMAQAAPKPEQFAGMHFFNPVDRMQLVEVIRGEKTSDQTVVTLVALAKKIGKTPIVVKDCPGFLVNRILFPYLNESLALLEEGADPRQIDKAATKFGMPMGPITLNDVVGLDTSLYAGRVIGAAFPERTVASSILDELVKVGRLGQKTGSGFYSYAKGSKGTDDPAFQEMLNRVRKGQKQISDEEVTDRLFLPMLTEASRVLAEGIVRSPADVDMGLILGLGFPPFRGGLLRWADTVGLDKILQKLAKYEALGARFQPTEMMRKLAATGKGFYG